MAVVIINDSPEARTALAELLYSEVDQMLADGGGFGSENWADLCEMLATLACNPVLFNNLSKDEVDDLVYRADNYALKEGLQSPNDFMFDFVAE